MQDTFTIPLTNQIKTPMERIRDGVGKFIRNVLEGNWIAVMLPLLLCITFFSAIGFLMSVL